MKNSPKNLTIKDCTHFFDVLQGGALFERFEKMNDAISFCLNYQGWYQVEG